MVLLAVVATCEVIGDHEGRPRNLSTSAQPRPVYSAVSVVPSRGLLCCLCMRQEEPLQRRKGALGAPGRCRCQQRAVRPANFVREEQSMALNTLSCMCCFACDRQPHSSRSGAGRGTGCLFGQRAVVIWCGGSVFTMVTG